MYICIDIYVLLNDLFVSDLLQTSSEDDTRTVGKIGPYLLRRNSFFFLKSRLSDEVFKIHSYSYKFNMYVLDFHFVEKIYENKCLHGIDCIFNIIVTNNN